MRAVGARVADHVQVLRDEATLAVDAGAEGERLRVADAGGHELLLARELEADGPARGEHEVADDVFEEHLLFAAEAAADARLHDPDAFHREAEQRGDHATRVERHLGRRAQHESFVLVEPAEGDVGLHRCVLLLGDAERLLEDVIGGGERLGHALVGDGLALDVVAHVAAGVVDPVGVRLVMDDRRAFCDGVELVEDRGQHVVRDLDPPARFLLGDLR